MSFLKNLIPFPRVAGRKARPVYFIVGFTLMISLPPTCVKALAAPRTENTWIDTTTGHRVIRLTNNPGLHSFYFHQSDFSPSGNAIVLFDSHNIYLYNRETKSESILYSWTDKKRRASGLVIAHQKPHLYYVADSAIWMVDLESSKTKEVAKIPAEWADLSSLTINADESQIAGTYTEGLKELEDGLPRDSWVKAERKLRSLSIIYSVTISSGKINIVTKQDVWLDHVQFSPKDPNLLMVNYQIPPSEAADTIFLLKLDGSDLHTIMPRKEHGEVLLHSFFSWSGDEVWYDLQVPWGQNHFIGMSKTDGTLNARYFVSSHNWSLHYNLSPDGAFIAGDGNDLFPDGKWLYLYKREGDHLDIVRLVNLGSNDYSLEPNVQFTPDGKWILFRANFEGQSYPYLVEVSTPTTGSTMSIK